ncbi:hypothetical protein PYCCODRAFT_1468513 [Trametes coccinea BRFM310]|uniref:Large ribosomal subunit protein mL49 n=1 Tax=Trametes coccinea (strain BRFM310) TaxID=1353009 RepID=A0A1Y2IN05_TRAC3|nr:hypothetical protein PYCCODRAFT_1468513 [Trametes coccinea BRFM310]
MFRSLVPRLFAPARLLHPHHRLFSAQVAQAAVAPSQPLPSSASASASTSPAQTPSQAHSKSPAAGTLPYRVPRNSRGSVPVYSQIRNHTRYFLLIRDVQGDIDAFVQDLKTSLFPEGSEQAARLKITTDRRQRVVVSGGRWKNEIIAWIVSRGF